ncbi:hypothetical protein [Streptomyces griseorubiginosus]|uniref:hypothetical protein n=1 Tax=Streptomyces griseorubiginosus TaxID=67304 RepID=UPI001AD73A1F|nr:hypothetical protein [Streptomyces griseorubiginosus]MBO4254188.1 hypothetical protein [Streptomyces griseorubiginosus]
MAQQLMPQLVGVDADFLSPGRLGQSRISHVGPPRTFAVLEEQMTTYVGASEAS